MGYVLYLTDIRKDVGNPAISLVVEKESCKEIWENYLAIIIFD